MIDYIKNLILGKDLEDENLIDLKEQKQTEIATCALFLEVAHSDDEFSPEEQKFVESTMKKIFNLTDETVNELIELSIQKTKKSVSLYEYTEIINEHFNKDAKYDILKNLWRLVFADGRLDSYEEHFMRKICGNLRMDHSDLISSKLEVKNENKKLNS